MSETKTTPRPRIIVELQTDGTLIAECYLNGSRLRENLNRGFELFEIKEMLVRIDNNIKSAAERKAEALAEKEKARHGTVWRYVAENHGVGFANRTVNGVNSLKRNAKVEAKAKKPNPELKEMLSLL